jgi:hypothetical protein
VGGTDRARERERGGQERNDERDCVSAVRPITHARPPLAGDYADPLSLSLSRETSVIEHTAGDPPTHRKVQGSIHYRAPERNGRHHASTSAVTSSSRSLGEGGGKVSGYVAQLNCLGISSLSPPSPTSPHSDQHPRPSLSPVRSSVPFLRASYLQAAICVRGGNNNKRARCKMSDAGGLF